MSNSTTEVAGVIATMTERATARGFTDLASAFDDTTSLQGYPFVEEVTDDLIEMHDAAGPDSPLVSSRGRPITADEAVENYELFAAYIARVTA